MSDSRISGAHKPSPIITKIVNSVTGDATGGPGGATGDVLTIHGTGFETITINYILLTLSTDSSKQYHIAPGVTTDTTVTLSYPCLPLGTYTVQFGTPTGVHHHPETSFNVCHPTARLSPAAGPLQGGTEVTLHGDYLLGATNVKFGSVVANGFNPVDNTQITVTSPVASEGGPVPITVEFPVVDSAKAIAYHVGEFSYNQVQFTISDFYPNFASAAGAQVRIMGTALSAENVAAVEFWNPAQTQKLATATPLSFSSDGSRMTFAVPTGLTVNASYALMVVATHSAGRVLAVAPGNPSFSYVQPAVVAGSVVCDSALTDDSKSLTLQALIANNTLNVKSTGDFAAAGELFIQTTNGVAILSYTGVVAYQAKGQAQDYDIGQFTGVTQYTTVPQQYQGLGDFDTVGTGLVLQSHASVLQATCAADFQLKLHQLTGGSSIYFLAYYSTAVPSTLEPTFYVLERVAGNTFQWKLTTPSTAVPVHSLPAGCQTLALPLIPTNAATFVFTNGPYSPKIETNASAGVPRPSPYVGPVPNPNVYDFVEYTFDATAGDQFVSLATRRLPKLTIDTTQVDQLGLGIQIIGPSAGVVPLQLATMPKPTCMTVNQVGVNSNLSLAQVFAAYGTLLNTQPAYASTLVQAAGQPGQYLRIVNPSDVLSNDASAATNKLNWAFDAAIYQLFTAPPGGCLSIDTGTQGVYIGVAKKVTIGQNSYQVLAFTPKHDQSAPELCVYMPLFSNNAAGAPNASLYQSVAAPAWLTSGPSTCPTSGSMVLANAGVFADHGLQPGLNASQQTALGNIEDQLVVALNRGCALTHLTSTYRSHTELWQDPTQHYPAGQAYNAYGAFMHTYLCNGATVFYGATQAAQKFNYGFAYAIAYDDQGNLSTTMTVVNDITDCQIQLSAIGS